MTTELRVRKIMDTDVVRLARQDTIRRAIAALVEQDAAAAAVLEADGALAGILTQKDCFRPALHASYYQEWRGTVADHMTANAVTIDASDDIVRAAEMFLEFKHRVFPVLDDGRLVGLLERAAVLKAIFGTG